MTELHVTYLRSLTSMPLVKRWWKCIINNYSTNIPKILSCKHTKDFLRTANIPKILSGLQTYQRFSQDCKHTKDSLRTANIPKIFSGLQTYQRFSQDCKHTKDSLRTANIPKILSGLQTYQRFSQDCKHTKDSDCSQGIQFFVRNNYNVWLGRLLHIPITLHQT